MHMRCDYPWYGTGHQAFYDGVTFETLLPMYPILFYDDFIGADVVIPASGAPESGCKWTKKIVGSATVGVIANGVNGLIECALTADSEKQDGALQMNDNLQFSLAQGAVFETRLALTTLPTLLGVVSFGLCGAWADAGSAYRVGFEVSAGGLVVCESDDAVTDLSASSGVTLVTGEYNIFRIDCTNQADIQFFINGNKVAGGTTFANAASAANSKCQSHVSVYKASGAGLGVAVSDAVKVFQGRS